MRLLVILPTAVQAAGSCNRDSGACTDTVPENAPPAHSAAPGTRLSTRARGISTRSRRAVRLPKGATCTWAVPSNVPVAGFGRRLADALVQQVHGLRRERRDPVEQAGLPLGLGRDQHHGQAEDRLVFRDGLTQLEMEAAVVRVQPQVHRVGGEAEEAGLA